MLRKYANVLLVPLLASAASAGEPKSKPVEVVNLPAVQDVNVVSGCSSGGAARVDLLGFTQAEVPGATGFFALLQACQTEFPGSQVCTSRQVLETTAIPSGLSGRAWVRPVFQPTGQGVTVDLSGLADSSPNFTCSGWLGTTDPGLTVDSSGVFQVTSPCSAPRPVACCGVAQ